MITIDQYEPQIDLTLEDKSFIKKILNNLTQYGKNPYSIPQEQVIDLIIDCAQYFFSYGRAVEQRFYHINYSDIVEYKSKTNVGSSTDPNMMGKIIQLSPKILVIDGVYEMSGKGDTSAIYRNLSDSIQLANQSAPYGQSIIGIDSGLFMIEAVTKMVEIQATKSIFQSPINFTYTPYTKTLNIKSDIKNNFIIRCDCAIGIQYLYKDPLFFRYVLQKSFECLFRIIAGHTKPLPGEVTVNPDAICGDFKTEIEKIETIVKAESSMGDIMYTR